jgi:hypothetical protein
MPLRISERGAGTRHAPYARASQGVTSYLPILIVREVREILRSGNAA